MVKWGGYVELCISGGVNCRKEKHGGNEKNFLCCFAELLLWTDPVTLIHVESSECSMGGIISAGKVWHEELWEVDLVWFYGSVLQASFQPLTILWHLFSYQANCQTVLFWFFFFWLSTKLLFKLPVWKLGFQFIPFLIMYLLLIFSVVDSRAACRLCCGCFITVTTYFSKAFGMFFL